MQSRNNLYELAKPIFVGELGVGEGKERNKKKKKIQNVICWNITQHTERKIYFSEIMRACDWHEKFSVIISKHVVAKIITIKFLNTGTERSEQTV